MNAHTARPLPAGAIVLDLARMTPEGDAPMNYFLAKTEPSTYSIDDLERDQRTAWDGVTNAAGGSRDPRDAPRRHRVFIYHSGGVSSVVGIGRRGIAAARRSEESRNRPMVDLEFAGRLEPPVTLGGDQGVGEVRRLGAGTARTPLDDGGAGKVRGLDARAISGSQNLTETSRRKLARDTQSPRSPRMELRIENSSECQSIQKWMARFCGFYVTLELG